MSILPYFCSTIALLSLFLLNLNRKKGDMYLANPLLENQEEEEEMMALS